MNPLSLATLSIGMSASLLAGGMRAEETRALTALNASRAAARVAPVSANTALVTKAQRWAKQLADRSGGSCSSATLRHSKLSDGAPKGWRALGENVGCRIAPGNLASQVAPLQASFMASPAHRANIMNRTYNVAGIGLATRPSAYNRGWLVVYEVQEFAKI